jgi:hypothetical protein
MEPANTNLRHPLIRQPDNLKTILDSLRSIFTNAIRGPKEIPLQNKLYPNSSPTGIAVVPKKFGAFTLFSHQTALTQEMYERESAFRQGASYAGLNLFSRFAILGDPVGTGKTIAALAYIAKCKQTGPLPVSAYLHSMSQSNFFSTCNIYPSNRTNLFIIPFTHLTALTDILEGQNEIRYKIIKKQNQINDNLLDEINQLDLIVVPSTQYTAFSEFMADANIIFERCFIEDHANLHLNINQCNIHAHFTWLITNNWFNLLFPDTSLFEYGITLDRIIEDLYMQNPQPNWFNDFIQYITFQRQIITNNTPMGRSIFSKFIVQHPFRHHLIVCTTGKYLQISIDPPSVKNEIINYNYDDRFHVIYPIFSPMVRQLIEDNDIHAAMDSIGAQSINSNEFRESVKDDSLDDYCPICFDEYSIPTITDCCKNIFCSKCLLKTCVLNQTNTCPMCRQTISATKLLKSIVNDPAAEERPGIHKTQALIKYLQANSEIPTMLYFPNQARFGKLKSALKNADIHYELLNGPRNANRHKIDRFNAGYTNLLIVNNEDYLTGFYIPKVSCLIFYPEGLNYNSRNILLNHVHRLIRAEPLVVVDFAETAVATATPTGAGVLALAGIAAASSGDTNMSLGDSAVATSHT